MTSEPEGDVAPPDTGAGPTPGPGDDRPLEERRLHPAATVIEAIHHARSFGVGFIAVIAGAGLTRGALIVLALLVVGALLSFVQWRTTRYSVVDHTLRLRTGIFERKEQNIPASRISALDTSRGLLQRMFGVVAVQVQTAGGKKKAELVLRAVSLAEAERLRRELGHRAGPAVGLAKDAATGTTGDGPRFLNPQAIADDAPVVFAMSPRELLMGALTSPSIAVVGAATAALYSVLSDLLPNSLQRTITGAARDLTVTSAIELAALAIAVATVVSVIGTVLLYAGFRITRDDRRLRIRRGLITERTGTVPIDRIHGVRVVESPLRQLLGYASIEVEVAGYASQDEATRTLVPFVHRREVPALIGQLVPGLAWPDAPLEAVPARARRRYVTFPLMFALVPTAALAAAPIGLGRAAAVVFPLIAIVLGRAAARDAGWRLSGDVLTLRWRWFGRSTLIARASRLQMVAARTSPWQRRAALATLRIRLSNARSGHVRYLDDGVAARLLEAVRR